VVKRQILSAIVAPLAKAQVTKQKRWKNVISAMEKDIVTADDVTPAKDMV
jgi:hypothetical protein